MRGSRFFIRWASLTLALIPVVVVATGGLTQSATALTLPSNCANTAGTVTCTFNYNGSNGSDGTAQSFTVPVGVASISVRADGAAGGAAPPYGSGGLGGQGAATLSVSPGTTLTVIVAGAGGNPNADLGGRGGFGGGGPGGDGCPPGCPTSPRANPGHGAGGGGGASTVSNGASPLVIGGGGGGGALAGFRCIDGTTVENSDGGDGGGLSGAKGKPDATCAPGDDFGGNPGTQAGPGIGELGGGNGGSGSGGAGASCTSPPSVTVTADGAGGGGAGYFGGAGGGGFCNLGGVVTGGGGGSGFVTAAATTAAYQTGVHTGNGLVTITYVLPTPSSKNACKNGGWRNYVDDNGRPFTNEGRCVDWAVHHLR